MKILFKVGLLCVTILSLIACGKADESNNKEKLEATKKEETKKSIPEDLVSTPYGQYRVGGEWVKNDWADNIEDGIMCCYTYSGEMSSNEVWVSELQISNNISDDSIEQINKLYYQNYKEDKMDINSNNDSKISVTLSEYFLQDDKTAYLFQVMDENNQVLANKYHLYHKDRMLVVEDVHSSVVTSEANNTESDEAAKTILETFRWPDEL